MTGGGAARGPGAVVILNGAPRAGKSSIAARLGDLAPGHWMRLGVDVHRERIAPSSLSPGVGLRPGGERPDLEDAVVRLYRALYRSIRAHADEGFDVVVDVGHHEAHSRPLHTLLTGLSILRGVPVWLIGVRCGLDEIMRRRRATGTDGGAAEGVVPAPVRRWQDAVHAHGVYDLEVHTDRLTPGACAAEIAALMASGTPNGAAARLLAR